MVGGLDALDRFFTGPANQLLAALQCGCEPLAGLRDFISGDIGGGRHQGARIFGEGAHVVFTSLFMFVHHVLFFLFDLDWLTAKVHCRRGPIFRVHRAASRTAIMPQTGFPFPRRRANPNPEESTIAVA